MREDLSFLHTRCTRLADGSCVIFHFELPGPKFIDIILYKASKHIPVQDALFIELVLASRPDFRLTRLLFKSSSVQTLSCFEVHQSEIFRVMPGRRLSDEKHREERLV